MTARIHKTIRAEQKRKTRVKSAKGEAPHPYPQNSTAAPISLTFERETFNFFSVFNFLFFLLNLLFFWVVTNLGAGFSDGR
jgi:hypothetical protein